MARNYRISKTLLDFVESQGYVLKSDEMSRDDAYNEMRRQDDILYSISRHVVEYPHPDYYRERPTVVGMVKGRDNDPPDL
jgi:hypothetical protein